MKAEKGIKLLNINLTYKFFFREQENRETY